MTALDSKPAIRGGVHVSQSHDSGHKHVSGTAEYIDDMPEPAGTLHAYLGLSTCAHGEIQSLGLEAVRAAPGVVGVLIASDVPGHNDISQHGKHDEPIFAETRVGFYGQPLFAVIATTREAARRAARLAQVSYTELPFAPDVATARQAGGALVTPGMKLERGDVASGLAASKHRLKGSMAIGGQDHFYLEGHIALAIPGEDDEITVHSSTQHPSEVQHMVGHALDRLRLRQGAFLFIENVGNLVCPAAFDLGEDCKVAILSVTEGEDKPLKYPDMFTASRLAILNKTDLAPHCDVDLDLYAANLKRVNPDIEIIALSARTGEGMDRWIDWLQARRDAKRAG